MQIRIYTEQAYNAIEHVRCGGWGVCHCPVRISWTDVKKVLERAALPGSEYETYIVVEH